MSRLVGIGTARPPYLTDQATIARFLAQAGAAQPGAGPRFGRYVEAFVRRSGIDTRGSVLADYTQSNPADFTFFPPSWRLDPFPTTAQRMAVYAREAVPLAEAAARAALADAGLAPQAVTHLVVTTCTGFFAPGPDVRLTQALGLSPHVHRAQIGFMGCFAGITGLRVADQIVRGDPGARVLLVAVELCSLHYQRTPDVETLVANMLFADGASAAVLAAEGYGPRVLAARSGLAHDTLDQMGWQVGDHGFVMRLSEDVPDHLRGAVRPFVQALLQDAGVEEAEVGAWAIHPGGRRVVEAVGAGLGLGPEALEASLGVLRAHGNMSSATILFVLDALRRARRPGPTLALAFGPGLTMEGLALSE